jgi:hypothetical protein
MNVFDILPFTLTASIVHLIVIFSIIGYVVGHFSSVIPSIGVNGKILVVVSSLVFIFGVFCEGAIYNEKKWKEKVENLEERLQDAEDRANKNNTKIEIQYKDRIKVVKDVQVVIQEKIIEVEKKIDLKCEVDSDAVKILNAAAKNEVK